MYKFEFIDLYELLNIRINNQVGYFNTKINNIKERINNGISFGFPLLFRFLYFLSALKFRPGEIFIYKRKLYILKSDRKISLAV